MKKRIAVCRTLIVLMLVTAASGFSQTDTLTVIHVNDTHSSLLPYGNGQYGGIARAASVIGLWNMTEPNPLFVHGGDLMVGDLMFNTYFGVPELQILDQLGCDAMVLGNHEFDVGSTDLGNLLNLAALNPNFTILCSNAINLDSVPSLAAIVHTSAIKQVGNLKVGLIGLTTPLANIDSNPGPVVIDDDLGTVLTQKITELKGEGCQIVLVLSHMGFAYDQQIAMSLPGGVDAIIGGHTHTTLSSVEVVNNIPIVQAGEFYRYVGKLRLLWDGSKTTVLDYGLEDVSPYPAEPNIQAVVDQLKQGVIAQYTPVLGDPYEAISYTDSELYDFPVAFDTLDTPMGNLVTRAMLNNAYAGEADLALEANGHIVQHLVPGNVSASDLFRAYPYGYNATDKLGFRLASFDLSGAQIWGILGTLIHYIDPSIGYYDYLIQTAGLDYQIEVGTTLELKQVVINGQPLYPDSLYKVVSSDRVVGYMDKLFGFTPANLAVYPVSVLQVIKEYVDGIDTLDIWRDGHIVAVPSTGVHDGSQTGIVRNFTLEQNYPNPFNPWTEIRFDLSCGGRVELKVFNLSGQEIRSLTESTYTAGTHRVSWDGRDNHGNQVPSGMYVYRIRVGPQCLAKRMTLVR